MSTLVEAIQQIKDRANIAEIIGEVVTLKRAGKAYKGNCPFHNENTGSFFVRPEEKNYKCFGCGVSGDVIDFTTAIQRVSKKDAIHQLAARFQVVIPAPKEKIRRDDNGRWVPFPDGSDRAYRSEWGEFVEIYEYFKVNGELSFGVLRTNPKGEFPCGRYTEHGWRWNVPDSMLIPYRLPQVMQAIEAKKTIYLVEGEKDANNLAKTGACSTTLPRGANKPWQKNYDVLAKAARIVIIADNDSLKAEPSTAGIDSANKIATNLWNLGAREIKIVLFPKHKDASDWLAAGGTIHDLIELVKLAQKFQPQWIVKEEPAAIETKPVAESPKLPLVAPPLTKQEINFLNRPGGYMPDTDSANGARFAHYFGEDWKYAHERGWMHYDGRRWGYDAKTERYEYAKQVGLKILANIGAIEDFTIRGELEKFAKKCMNRAQLDSLLALSKSEAIIRASLGDFDSERTDLLLNFNNGTVDLETGIIRDHDRGDFITRVIPFDYNPDADCPLWIDHLNKVFSGNQEIVDWFWRLAGYCSTGLTRDHVMPFFEGGGANGKSITVNVLCRILGEYAGTLPTTSLMQKQNDNNMGNDIAAALPKRFVTVSEAAEGMKLNEALLKQLTGGDEVSVRFLHKEFFNARPKFKLIMTGNSRPRVTGNDHGMWRRIKLVRFERKFSGEDRIADFDKLLINKEAEGIAAWLVRGAKEYLERGLQEPDCIKQWTEEYKQASDPAGAFLMERCSLYPGKRDYCERAQDLYDGMKTFCEDNGFHCPSIQTFSERVKAHGLERVKRNDGNYYIYVQLKGDYRK